MTTIRKEIVVLEVNIVKFIIIGIIVVAVIIALKNSRKPPLKDSNGVDASKGEWKNQLQEIENKRLSEEKRTKQVELKVMEEHRKISEKLWPRISEVCKGFALAKDFKYKEKLNNFIKYKNHESCYSNFNISSYGFNITIGLLTEYGRFGDNLCRSHIYINGEIPGREVRETVIHINEFTEELLVTKLIGLAEV